MAASSKKKKVVNKDDLRRLMKEKTNASKSSAKRIDSPLAKYNNIGQLSCVVCNAPVKSELLWNAHIQGKTHKENIARLKAEKEQKEHCFVRPASPPVGKKRKHDDAEILAKLKTAKAGSKDGKDGSLPADFFDSKKPKLAPPQSDVKPKSILRTSANYGQEVVAGSSGITSIGGYGGDEDSDDDDDEEEYEEIAAARNPVSSGTVAAVTATGLPADFFDKGVVPSSSAPPPEAKTPEANMSEKLPEGFFDDPKMDAKVRKVEYKDKMEEEWELFQKAMKEENNVSEAILEEDEDIAYEERQLTEVEEQLLKWTKISELASKKEKLMSRDHPTTTDSTEDTTKAASTSSTSKTGSKAHQGSSSDTKGPSNGTEQDSDEDEELGEEDLEELCSWRAKSA